MRRVYTRGVVALEEEEKKIEAAAAAAADEAAADVGDEGADKVEVEKEEIIGDNAESLETDLIEVGDDVAEGEEQQAEVEEAGEVVEALESIADALKISAANGGLDKNAAAIVGIATQHLYDRVGLKTKCMPALESFGGTSSRIDATKLVMEDIKEQAKKIWAAIVSAFERAIQWAKDFYLKIFQSWEKLEKRATDLAGKAGEAKGGAKIENERLCKELAVDGKAPSMTSDLGKFEAFFKNGFGAAEPEVLKAYASQIDFVLSDKELDSINLPAYNRFGFSDLKEATGTGFPEAKEGLGIYRSEEMFGNTALVCVLPKEEIKGKEAAALVNSLSMKIGAFNPSATSELKEIPSLNAAEIKAVTEAIVEIAKAGTTFKSSADEIESIKKKLVEAAKKYGSEENENDKEVRTILTGLTKNMDQPAASITVYGLRTCKALLDLVEESIKGEKAKPEEKTEEKSEEKKEETKAE